MTKLHNLFTKNVLVKIICLSMATVLWIYVASAQNSIAKFPGSIPIKSFNSKSDLVAVYDVKSVEIKVMAESSNWKNLSADSFSAYVDLSSYSAGTFEVPVSVVSSVPGVQVVEKNPDTILVSLEPMISKEVPITQKIEGAANDGMVAGTVNFNPKKATITGAKGIVENISEVTGKIQLNGESVDFDRKVALVLPEGKYSQSNIGISPTEAIAQVSIIKGSGVKTVGIKANIVGAPQSNFYVSEIKVLPSTADIIGSAEALSDTKHIETMAIDISNIATSLSKEAQLTLPEGIYLSDKSFGKVQVEVSLAPIDGVQEVSTSNFKLLNSNGMTLISSVPSEIKIRYTAPASLIGIVKLSDFQISIDLSHRTLNSAGSYDIELTKDLISAPVGVSIIEVSPSNLVIRTKN